MKVKGVLKLADKEWTLVIPGAGPGWSIGNFSEVKACVAILGESLQKAEVVVVATQAEVLVTIEVDDEKPDWAMIGKYGLSARGIHGCILNYQAILTKELQGLQQTVTKLGGYIQDGKVWLR